MNGDKKNFKTGELLPTKVRRLHCSYIGL